MLAVGDNLAQCFSALRGHKLRASLRWIAAGAASAGHDNAQDGKIAHFIACIQDGLQPIVTPREIINVALIIDAVYESGRTGKAVDISRPEL